MNLNDIQIEVLEEEEEMKEFMPPGQALNINEEQEEDE
jgi:hypothetical protein